MSSGKHVIFDIFFEGGSDSLRGSPKYSGRPRQSH